jgi:hypothetical protein
MNRQRFSRIAHSTHVSYNPLSEAKLDRVLGLVPLTADSHVLNLGAGRCQRLSDAVTLLEEALSGFPGALVTVTHDAALAHAVGQHFITLGGTGRWSQESIYTGHGA